VRDVATASGPVSLVWALRRNGHMNQMGFDAKGRYKLMNEYMTKSASMGRS